MAKLSWQMTTLYAIGMVIMGAIIVCGFFVETNGMDQVAFALLCAMLGYGGGKVQTIWEIRKGNSNVRQSLPPQRGRRADEPSEG